MRSLRMKRLSGLSNAPSMSRRCCPSRLKTRSWPPYNIIGNKQLGVVNGAVGHAVKVSKGVAQLQRLCVKDADPVRGDAQSHKRLPQYQRFAARTARRVRVNALAPQRRLSAAGAHSTDNPRPAERPRAAARQKTLLVRHWASAVHAWPSGMASYWAFRKCSRSPPQTQSAPSGISAPSFDPTKPSTRLGQAMPMWR